MTICHYDAMVNEIAIVFKGYRAQTILLFPEVLALKIVLAKHLQKDITLREVEILEKVPSAFSFVELHRCILHPFRVHRNNI